MLLRRYIRIRALQSCYTYVIRSRSAASPITDVQIEVERELIKCLDETTKLAWYIVLLIQKIRYNARLILEDEKNKFFPDPVKIDRITHFLSIDILNNLDAITVQKYLKGIPVDTNEINDLALDCFTGIVLNKRNPGEAVNQDNDPAEPQSHFPLPVITNPTEFLHSLVNYPSLAEYAEQKNIFWSDALSVVPPLLQRICLAVEKKDSSDILSGVSAIGLLKNPEQDMEFALGLLKNFIAREKEFDAIISSMAANWALDRVVMMDRIILILAFCEIKGTSGIPPKVTMNEYIEISKYFSTPESGNFINGILDRFVNDL